MGEFMLGLFLGFAAGITFIVPSTDPASVEERAKSVYERRAASLDWYEGNKHIQPWSKLSPEEQEQWRKPLRKYVVK